MSFFIIVILVTLMGINQTFCLERCEYCLRFDNKTGSCEVEAPNSAHFYTFPEESKIYEPIVSPSECMLELDHHGSEVLNITVGEFKHGICDPKVSLSILESCHIEEGDALYPHQLEFTLQNVSNSVVSFRFKDNVTLYYAFMEPSSSSAKAASRTRHLEQIQGKHLLHSTSSLEFCRNWNENYTRRSNYTKIYCSYDLNSSKHWPCNQTQARIAYINHTWSIEVVDDSLVSVVSYCYLNLKSNDKYLIGDLHQIQFSSYYTTKASMDFVASGSALVILALVISAVLLWRRTKKKRLRLISDSSTVRTKTEEFCLIEDCTHFPLQNFQLGEILGCGQFGEVRRATLIDGSARWDVALKAAKKTEHPCELTREGEIMRRASYNENIVNLQGITVPDLNSDEIYLVLEYCSNGSLVNYLKDNRVKFSEALANVMIQGDGLMNLDARENFNMLIAWSHQIAKGMEFLVRKSVIHGDLAARNVLLTSDLTAKLSDFGLAVEIPSKGTRDDLPNGAKLRTKECPVRWMAPESLLNGYVTTCSDVWAFGVVLWEIFSLASFPYDGVSIKTNSDMLAYLEAGHRLDPPPLCPRPIYDMMRQCWLLQPQERPQFSTLASTLSELLCTDYQRKYEDIVKRLSVRHTTIQNMLYQLMTSNGLSSSNSNISNNGYYFQTNSSIDTTISCTD